MKNPITSAIHQAGVLQERLSGRKRKRRCRKPTNLQQRRVLAEQLEQQVLLAAHDLVDTQPDGNLSGKIVYTHAGHGWVADTNKPNRANNSFQLQRPTVNELQEDFGNQDQMTLFADYVFSAGGTVVPLRPVGHQLNEVVLDNPTVGADATGSNNPIHFDNSSDVRFSSDQGSVSYVGAWASRCWNRFVCGDFCSRAARRCDFPGNTWCGGQQDTRTKNRVNYCADRVFQIANR